MGRTAPDVALRAHVGQSEDLMHQVAEGILDLAVLYGPRYRPGLVVELLVEEKLVLVTTSPGVGGDAPPYVHVDWGPEFALWRGPGRVDRGEPALHVGLGPLGLGYILASEGSGYFRMGAVRPHLESGRLALVPGAPEFLYPAYAVHLATDEAGAVQTALDGLRSVVRADGMGRVGDGNGAPEALG